MSLDTELIQGIYTNTLLNDYSMYQKRDKKYNEFRQATHTKEYKGIYFCFYVKDAVFTKLEILFKPHYYFNDNLHNANDFKAIDCIKTLIEIKNLFNFPVTELKIINIEFGINAISPIDCKNLIEYTFYHKKNLFISSSNNLRYSKINYKHKDNGTANTYKMIKFYAKGLQFPQYTNINTFRFEVKSKQSKYIKTLGIYTYADLLKFETYQILSDTLKKEFEKILIIDAENKMHNLNDKEKRKLFEYLNPIKWNKSIQGSKNLFNNYRKKYFALLDKTENNIHVNLKNIINKKLDDLLKTCAISKPLQKTKMCAVSTINIIGNSTHLQTKRCLATGLDISM